jgi:hypothetical protein
VVRKPKTFEYLAAARILVRLTTIRFYEEDLAVNG